MLERNIHLFRIGDAEPELHVNERRIINGTDHVYFGSLIVNGHNHPIRKGILQFGAHQNEELYNKMWRDDAAIAGPSPGVSGRERLLFMLGAKPFGFLEGKTMLDAGAGLGYRTQSALELGANVIALDSSYEGLKSGLDRMSRQLTPEQFARLDFVQADIFQKVFAPNSFDVVFSSFALHHTADTKQAMFHIAEYTKPGGWLAITVFVLEDNFPNTVWVCRSEIMRLPRDVRQRAMAKAGLLKDQGVKPIINLPEIFGKVQGDPDLAAVSKEIGLLYLVHRENLDTEYMWVQSMQDVARWMGEAGFIVEFQCGETTVGRRRDGVIDIIRGNRRLRNMLISLLDKIRGAIQ